MYKSWKCSPISLSIPKLSSQKGLYAFGDSEPVIAMNSRCLFAWERVVSQPRSQRVRRGAEKRSRIDDLALP